MAQANVEVKVQSQDLDRLRGQLVELQKGLKIQYDIDGKPIDIVIDKSLNLQKQIRLLTAELRKTKEGTDEFRILSSRLGQAEDDLAKTTAKSKDLLASLQLLPGPVGQFFSQLNGTIGLLKVFSSFSLKDVAFQFKEFNDDINDIAQNIFGIKGAATEAKAELADTASTIANTGAESANTAATLQNADAQKESTIQKGKDVIATKADTLATLQNTLAETENSLAQAKNTIEKSKATAERANELIATRAYNTEQEREIIIRERNAALALKGQAQNRVNQLEKQRETLITKINTAATQEAAAATTADTLATENNNKAKKGLGSVIKGLMSSTLLWIGVIAAAGYALYKWLQSTAELTREQKALNDLNEKQVKDFGQLKVQLETYIQRIKEGTVTQRQKNEMVNEYNKSLGDTLGKVKSYEELERKLIENGPLYVKYLELKARAESAYQLSVERGKQLLESELKNSVEYANAFDIWKEGGFLGFIYDTTNKAGQKKKEEFLQGLKKDQIDFLNIFNTTSKELETLATQLKIPGATVEGMKTETPKEDPRIQATRDLYKQLNELIDENEVTIIEKERERQRKELERQKNAELQKVKELKLVDTFIETERGKVKINAEETRGKMIEQIKKKYNTKSRDLENGFRKQDEEKLKEYNDKIFNIMVASMDKEVEAQKKIRKKQYDDDLKELEKNENFKNETTLRKLIIRAALYQKYFKDLEKIVLDDKIKTQEKEVEKLDEELRFLQLKSESLIEGTRQFYLNRREIINKAEERELAQAKKIAIEKKKSEEELEKELQAIRDKYKLKREQDRIDELSSYLNMAKNIAGTFSGFISSITEANQIREQNELQRAKGNAQKQEEIRKQYWERNKRASIAQAYISTFQSAIDAFLAFAKIPKVGPILGGIAAAAALAFGESKISAMRQQQYESTTGGMGGIGMPSGEGPRGYAKGGVIDGARHAQGGVLIEAEGGEAIMTRGAVSMFGPLLAMMNQAGGGTNFNKDMMVTANDAPASSPSGQAQEPVIMKTYVVSNELTTEMEKQARLKNLSTL